MSKSSENPICAVDFEFINTIRNDKNLYKFYDINDGRAISIHDERIIKTHDCNKYKENGKYEFVVPEVIHENLENYLGNNYRQLLKKFGFVVAGGSLTSDQYDVHDVDIFIIGSHDIKYRINEFIKTLNPKKIWFSNNCMTLYNEYVPIQIILKYYDSILDLLNDFDLGSSMVCFDGDDILTNGEGKFALETGYNIVNLVKYRHSYKTRLCKYNRRGFGILHTNLAYEYGFNITNFGINIIDKMKESSYDSNVKYEMESYIMTKNIRSIQKGGKYLCIDVTGQNLMVEQFEVKISDAIFELFDTNDIGKIKEKLKELNLLTDSEIKDILLSIVNDVETDKAYQFQHPYLHQILNEKFDTLTASMTMPYEVKYGLIDPLSKPDEIDGFYNEGAYIDHSDIKIALK